MMFPEILFSTQHARQPEAQTMNLIAVSPHLAGEAKLLTNETPVDKQ